MQNEIDNDNVIYIENEPEDELTLMQLLRIIGNRFWMTVILVILALGIAVLGLKLGFFGRPSTTYDATATAMVTPIDNNTYLASLIGAPSVSLSYEVQNLGSAKNVDAALDIINLSDYVTSSGESYDKIYKKTTGQDFLNSGKVSIGVSNNILSVTVRDNLPKFCEDFANALIVSSEDIMTELSKNSRLSVQRELIEKEIRLNHKNIANLSEELEEDGGASEALKKELEIYQTLDIGLNVLFEATKLLENPMDDHLDPINPATAVARTSGGPKKTLIIAVAVLLGGAVGILLELFVNFKDKRIHDSETVQKIVGSSVPELGWFPLLSQSYNGKLVTLTDPQSFAAERVSFIANNLSILGSKIIGITSASRGKDRSALACNLAITYAQMGKKVLLVDGNLRHPSLEKVLGLPKAVKGIGDVALLSAKVEDVTLTPVKGLENLKLLCVGDLKANPSVVLESSVLPSVSEKFDMVLVDVPTMDESPEFTTLVSLVDSMVLSVRTAVANKMDLSALIDRIKLIDKPISGFVYGGVIVNDKRASYGCPGSAGYSYQGSEIPDMLEKPKYLIGRIYKKAYELELRG